MKLKLGKPVSKKDTISMRAARRAVRLYLYRKAIRSAFERSIVRRMTDIDDIAS